jgi:hypothetical protein
MIALLLAACFPEPEVEAPPAPAPKAAPKAPKPKGKRKPKSKPCLGTGDVTDEAGMVASEGLDEEQIAAAMKPAFPIAAQCVADAGATPSAPLELEIVVSCGGVVSGVDVKSRGDWPQPAVDCVVAGVGFLEFPAHGLPDGDRFGFPFRWSP